MVRNASPESRLHVAEAVAQTPGGLLRAHLNPR
jgi:hypothetical protein